MNLMSLGMLQSRGYEFKLENNHLYVLKETDVVMKSVRKHSLYYLIAEPVIWRSDAVADGDMSLWHKRLCHVGKKGLTHLIKSKAIRGATVTDYETCEQCILAKSKKSPYQKSKFTSTAPLQYAHSDLWGRARNESLGGGKYFISIMDDFSRKLWIYILKNKS